MYLFILILFWFIYLFFECPAIGMIFWKPNPWRSSVWLQSILFQSFTETNHFLNRGSKIYVHGSLTGCFYTSYIFGLTIPLFNLTYSTSNASIRPRGETVHNMATRASVHIKAYGSVNCRPPWQQRPRSFDFSWFWWNSESLALREPQATGLMPLPKSIRRRNKHPQFTLDLQAWNTPCYWMSKFVEVQARDSKPAGRS